MPVEKLTEEQIMVGKMSRVTEFAKSLVGKCYGDKHPGGRPEMAKMVVFQTGFISMKEIVRTTYHDPLLPEEVKRINESLDYLIDVFNSTLQGWELFLKGEKAIKPKEYTIALINSETQEKIFTTIEDLSEICF